MGMMVYSLLWGMQDFYHQPYSVHMDPKARELNRSSARQDDAAERATASGCLRKYDLGRRLLDSKSLKSGLVVVYLSKVRSLDL